MIGRVNAAWMAMQTAAGEEPFHLPFGGGRPGQVIADPDDLDRVEDVSSVDIDELYEALEAEGLVVLHDAGWVTIRVYGPLRK